MVSFALCRRLNTLNKCAVMKLEISPHRKRVSAFNSSVTALCVNKTGKKKI